MCNPTKIDTWRSMAVRFHSHLTAALKIIIPITTRENAEPPMCLVFTYIFECFQIKDLMRKIS